MISPENLAEAVSLARPGACFTINPERLGYSALKMLDGSTKPSLAEIEAAWAARPAPPKIWPSVADFNNEFTAQEKKAIIRAARQDDDMALLDRELMAWRGEVWSTDARVVAGLDALVANRILTTERRTQILT